MTKDASPTEVVKMLDRRAHAGRTKRLRLLLNRREYAPFPIDALAFEYFEEARLCWYVGSFVAAIIMSELAFEELLRSRYRIAKCVQGKLDSGKKVDDAGFVDLLEQARLDRTISRKEWLRLDGIRILRNPYVHTKDWGHKNKPSFFVQLLKYSSPVLVGVSVEGEAKRSVSTLVSLLPVLARRFFGT